MMRFVAQELVLGGVIFGMATLLSACSVEDSFTCNRADNNCAAVDLEVPTAFQAGRAISLSGSCTTDGSSVAVDFQGDGVPTPGVSRDPLSCSCDGNRLSCPSVTIDPTIFSADQVSLKTMLTNRIGQTAQDNDSINLVYLDLVIPPSINDNTTFTPTGVCAPNGSSVTITAPSGFSPTQTSCSCTAHALSSCGAFTETTATLSTSLTFSAQLTAGSLTASAQGVTWIGNLPPVPRSLQVGLGYSYQASQLGGLTFTRYGHDAPSGNRVSCDESMDFIDEPVKYASGYRADGSAARQTYYWPGTSSLGWAVSSQTPKYADSSGFVTPVNGGDFFGDTYRGYFVPTVDALYNFVNLVIPDNSVRVMMAPNECSHAALAVLSADLAGQSGAVDPLSKWINGNGGSYSTLGGGPFGANNEYLHNTSAFYPLGSSDPSYLPGSVYLLAGRIYYLEIRYSETGGGNAFQFGYRKKTLGSAVWGAVEALPASVMIPFTGTDRYLNREACLGQFDGASMFSDPESDSLVYSARLVGSNDGELIAPASHLSSVGLAINSTTGLISGTLRSYAGQKIIITARDPLGSNTRVDSFPVRIIP